jgi:hypothetical protein
LIGDLGVGDRGLSFERLQPTLLGGVAGCRDLLVKELVDEGVDPRDEERGDRADAIDWLPRRPPRRECRDVGASDTLVGGDREEEGDIDVDPLGQHLLDDGDSFDRARDLDQQVRPVDGRPEPAGIGRSDGRVARGEGRDFDRDEPVAALG